MPNGLRLCCVLLCLAAPAAWAASVERADELYLAGDLDAARAELAEVLAADEDEVPRAAALALLGRIEVDRRNWRAALDAWGELTDSYASSAEAAAVSAAIRPLQALVDCACAGAAAPALTAAATPEATPEKARAASPEPTPATAEAAEASRPAPPATAAPPAAAPAPAVPGSEPATPPAPARGLILVGGWGAEYEASQEVTRDLVTFLEQAGVGVRAASTDVPAVHGEEVVLSYLIDEARQAGAAGVLFVTTRFDFREFIHVRRYDVRGSELWSDKIFGGTALRERRDRGQPSWNLVDRMKKRLEKRLGTPDLPVS